MFAYVLLVSVCVLENESALPKCTRAANPVERRETPPKKTEVKAKMSDPTANSEILHAGKRPLSRLVSGLTGAGASARAARASSPVGPLQSRSGDASVVPVRGQKQKEPRGSGW